MLESQSLDNLDSALRNCTRGLLTSSDAAEWSRIAAREQALAAEYERRGESVRYQRVADAAAEQFEQEQREGLR